MDIKFILDLIDAQAKFFSGCTKVHVGSAIVGADGVTKTIGANRTDKPCKELGCLRQEKYGDNNKTHRNPDDCRAIHSEIEAISLAAKLGLSTQGATIFITRYPCEGCARAIIKAGITTVIYGRKTAISKMTADMFEEAGIEVIHEMGWDADDATN